MMSEDDVEIKQITPKAIFGFDGRVKFGLNVHPNGNDLVFPLGTKIGISNLATNQQQFLSGGHTNTVSTLDISPSGNLLASGQISQMGFRAYVILWDYKNRKEIARHDLHKVRVESVSFTSKEKYLVSLGGQDDGTIIVYDVETLKPLCRSVASKGTAGHPTLVSRLHKTSTAFVVAGDRHLRIWNINREQKKLAVQDVAVGKIQRCYTSMRIDSNDENLYLATMTGDIVKVKLNCCDPINVTKQGQLPVLLGSYGCYNPKKPKYKDCDKYTNGVRDIFIIKNEEPAILLIGAGDGTIELVEERNVCFKTYKGPTWPNLKSLLKTKINGAISSLTRISNEKYIIGTENSEIFLLNLKNFELKLILTCHKSTVYDIQFPKGFSLVFATAGHETIRIWSTKRMQELLRIIVHNFSCAAIKFTNDGASIISAWNDGVLRAFTPITGKLIWAIPNAHNKGCSAVTISNNGRLMISGGIEGQVRVWKVEPFRQSLIGVLKEHSAPISTLDFNKFDTEVVSACHDGSCVIWDINRMARKHVFYANTQFMSAKYYPTGVQILTAGTDRRISYWEVYDGSLVRELEGSPSASVNCVSINTTGEYFISASNVVKLWDYTKGITLCLGETHASAVISCMYSPCGKFFVTGSDAGAVMIWDIPQEYWPKNIDPLATISSDTSLNSRRSSNTSIDTKRTLGSAKKENIEELETTRTKTCKEVLCAECPPVDCKAQPDINESCNF